MKGSAFESKQSVIWKWFLSGAPKSTEKHGGATSFFRRALCALAWPPCSSDRAWMDCEHFHGPLLLLLSQNNFTKDESSHVGPHATDFLTDSSPWLWGKPSMFLLANSVFIWMYLCLFNIYHRTCQNMFIQYRSLRTNGIFLPHPTLSSVYVCVCVCV